MKLVSSQAQPQINLEQARGLGELMQRERETRQLSPQDVADKLLLSRNQILGLETGNLTYFYGSKLYAQAAEKYAAFLKLAESPTALLFGHNEEAKAIPLINEQTATETISVPDEPLAVAARPSPKLTQQVRRGSMLTAGLIVLGMMGGIFYSQLQNHEARNIATQQPTTIKPISTEPPPPATTAPVTVVAVTEATPAPAAIPANTIPTDTIILRFNGSSWVQVVAQNGSKQEKTYRTGETLTLQPAKLQALVIGNAGVVTVSNSKTDISLKHFVAAGSQVARLIGPQIRNISQ